MPGIVCTVPVEKVVQKPSVARRVNEAGVMVHALVRACGVRPACRLEIGHDPAAYYGRWTCLRRPAAGSCRTTARCARRTRGCLAGAAAGLSRGRRHRRAARAIGGARRWPWRWRQRGDEVRDGDSRAASLCRTSDHRTVRRLGSREAHARSAAAGDERTRLDGAVRLEQRGDMGAGRRDCKARHNDDVACRSCAARKPRERRPQSVDGGGSDGFREVRRRRSGKLAPQRTRRGVVIAVIVHRARHRGKHVFRSVARNDTRATGNGLTFRVRRRFRRDTSGIFQVVPCLGGSARRSRAWRGGARCRTGLMLRRNGGACVAVLLREWDSVWISTSELGLCGDLREPPRHRADAVTGTTSCR